MEQKSKVLFGTTTQTWYKIDLGADLKINVVILQGGMLQAGGCPTTTAGHPMKLTLYSKMLTRVQSQNQ